MNIRIGEQSGDGIAVLLCPLFQFARVANIVDKILRGAKAGDIPIEQGEGHRYSWLPTK